jgi:flagella basal body P-ring formation protein FlgA
MFPIIAIILACAGADAPAAEVRLRAQASCSTTIVRLTDVADVLSNDERLAQALADVPLCPTPTMGTERTLTQHDVRQLLALSGVERTACRMTGSEFVTISPASAASGHAAKRPIVAAGVRQAVFTENDAAKVAVRPAAASVAPDLPPKKTAMPLVERGMQVTVIARAAGVRITASGKALQSGAADEMVNVELPDTKQRILARVIGPQTVEMAATGITSTSN